MKTYKKLFLIDGLGALVTAFFLGFVLIRLNNEIGIPKEVLYILALLPFVFAVYSFCCYFLLKRSWEPFLRGIAFANLAYCCLTVGLMMCYYTELKFLGWLYFLVEILVILVLVAIELKTASRRKGSKN